MLSDSTTCEARGGTYAVLLRPQQAGRIRIGRLGELTLDGGVLLYVGSNSPESHVIWI